MTGACILLLAGALDGAVATPSATPAPKVEASGPAGYRLGPEDIVEIDVWNRPELSRKVPVRPDGRISLPLLNDVPTSGLTPMELRDILLARLAEYVTAPEVSVIVAEVRSFRVSVLGEVSRPGRFELKSQVRLVDALAMAGGLTQYASRSNIVVLRSNGHGLETHRFDYDKLRAADARMVNFFLQPDDVLLVP
jgi:polysaccharide export outer membrane protein